MGATLVSSHIGFLIDSLSDPSLYPGSVDKVEVIQTHISVVFIAGDFVYKIKKPLNLGFLDYTTLDKRRFFCNQEVILNSRFSEGIYLDVVNIYRRNSSLSLSGPGQVFEVAVLMKKIPQERILKRLLLNDELNDEHLTRLAVRLNGFHQSASKSHHISQFGIPEVIHRNLKENFEQVQNFTDVTIETKLLDEISSGSFEFLGKYLPNFKDRVKKGFIRDLHGDLHSEHIVFMDDVMLVDCIEFNDRFRYSDVVSDIAFLLMDMDYLGFPALSTKLHNNYSNRCEDEFECGLYRFYKSYRAFVRAKVNSFTLNEPEISQEALDQAKRCAQEYFRLSAWYLRSETRPCLFVMCGLMGSGKTFMAKKLAHRTGAVVVRSDVVRKELVGVGLSERHFENYSEGIYSSDVTDQTYCRILEIASENIRNGCSVILDASFGGFERRESARKLASELGARFFVIQITAPDDVIKTRLDDRVRTSDDPSDGRWELYHQQKFHFDEMNACESGHFLVYDSSKHSEVDLGSLVRRLLFL